MLSAECAPQPTTRSAGTTSPISGITRPASTGGNRPGITANATCWSSAINRAWVIIPPPLPRVELRHCSLFPFPLASSSASSSRIRSGTSSLHSNSLRKTRPIVRKAACQWVCCSFLSFVIVGYPTHRLVAQPTSFLSPSSKSAEVDCCYCRRPLHLSVPCCCERVKWFTTSRKVARLAGRPASARGTRRSEVSRARRTGAAGASTLAIGTRRAALGSRPC